MSALLDSPVQSRLHHSIASIACLAVLSLGLVATSPLAAADETLTYVLTETWTEGNSGDTSLEVRQRGSVTVGSFESHDSPALVSHPENGVLTAWVEDRPPVLVNLVEVPSELEVGDPIEVASASVARIDALEFHLERGDDDATIEGRSAQHHVLTLEVEWSGTGTNDLPISGRSSGSADLWTVEDLPYSWMPYMAPKGFAMAAVPLSFNHPDVAAFVLWQLGAELQELGLLVRAEARSVAAHDNNGFKMEQSFTREVEVGELATSEADLEVTVPERPLLTQAQYAGFMGVMFIGQEACTSEAGTSSLVFETHMNGEGTARVERDERRDGQPRLVLGSLRPGPDGPGSGCLIVDLSGERISEGAIPVSFSRGAGAADSARASAYHMAGNQQEIRLTLVEDGQLDIRRDAGGWSASLEGTAWSMTLVRSGGASKEDGLPVDVSFTFEPEETSGEPAG